MNDFKPPKECDYKKEEIQKNTPLPRTGHAIGKIKDNIYLMTGGVTIPEAGPMIEHPKDSSTWLLNVNEKEWVKCNNCELMIRSGHAMMVHMEKAYIVGGYNYTNYKLHRLFPIDEVIEASIVSSEIIITRKFKLTNLTGESIPNMYGFSNTSTDKFMYTFGGNKVCDYSDNLKNLNVFHNPTLDRHKLLPHSSTMFEINVIDAEIKSVNAAPEYRNAKEQYILFQRMEMEVLIK